MLFPIVLGQRQAPLPRRGSDRATSGSSAPGPSDPERSSWSTSRKRDTPAGKYVGHLHVDAGTGRVAPCRAGHRPGARDRDVHRHRRFDRARGRARRPTLAPAPRPPRRGHPSRGRALARPDDQDDRRRRPRHVRRADPGAALRLRAPKHAGRRGARHPGGDPHRRGRAPQQRRRRDRPPHRRPSPGRGGRSPDRRHAHRPRAGDRHGSHFRSLGTVGLRGVPGQWELFEASIGVSS